MIGVIVMVAITIILAAVIGTFVLGLGENVQDSAPQANFQFEYADDFTLPAGSPGDGNVTVTHTGGEDVELGNIGVQVDGTAITADLSAANGAPNGIFTAWSDPVDTGDSIQFNETAVSMDQGDTVRVVWTSPSGGTSNTIGQSTVPS